MMFYATLYKSTADPRERDKTEYLTQIGSNVPINPTAQIDTMSPRIIIDYNATLIDANYIYLPAFDRYYFSRPPIIETGKRIIFDCTVDLLMTCKDALLDVPATIVRSESVGAPTYIPDKQLPIDPCKVDLESIKFSSTPFGASYNYILSVI